MGEGSVRVRSSVSDRGARPLLVLDCATRTREASERLSGTHPGACPAWRGCAFWELQYHDGPRLRARMEGVASGSVGGAKPGIRSHFSLTIVETGNLGLGLRTNARVTVPAG